MLSFLIYSFAGWLLMSAALSVKAGRFVNAGFLYAPFCPIFGVCMLFLIIFAYPHNLLLPLLFFVCAAAAMITEYYASLIFEQLFSVWLWDYSGCAYSVNGRIRVRWSLFWGAAATAALTFAQPLIDGATLPRFMPARCAQGALFAAATFLLADFAFSLRALLSLKRRLAKMTGLRGQFREYLRRSNVSYRPRQLLELNIGDGSLIEAVHDKGVAVVSYSDIPEGKLAATLALISTRYDGLCRPSPSERRLLGALPLLRVYDEAESLRALKP